jgi:hypothetical protein
MATTYYNAVLGRMVEKEPRKPRRVRVYLENNQYVLVPKYLANDIVGITEYGDLVVRSTDSTIPAGQYEGLTGCCGATAKGCDGYIGCRFCYREVDSMLGAPLRISDIYLKVRGQYDYADL